ncbi:MAG: hypothetical protein AAGB46_16090 [Verrucomicrobiota bacterium]
MSIRLTLFGITAVIAIIIGIVGGFYLFPSDFTTLALRQITWVTLLTLICAFSYLVIAEYAASWRRSLKSRPVHIAILLCLAATSFLFTREPLEYKIVFDEPVLVSASHNLHLDRDPVMVDRLREDVPTDAIRIDKRPFLFPFALSLIHDVLGYRVSNGHILNFAATFAFLATLYGLCIHLRDRYSAISAVALCCGLPILAQNAAGLGMEMLNLFLLALAYLTAIQYAKAPSERRLSIFLLTIVLLAHTRYESSLYALAAGTIVLSSWLQRRKVQISWGLIVTPLYFIPLAWQQAIIWSDSSYMQLSDDDSAFSFSNFPNNLYDAMVYFFATPSKAAGSPILGLLGFASLAAIIFFALSKKAKIPFAAIVIGCNSLLAFTMLMSYFWGQVTDNMVTRLTLPIWLILIISSACCLAYIASNVKRWFPPLIVSTAVLYALPIMNAHIYTKRIPFNQRYDWVEQNLNPLLSENSLVITNYTRIYQNMGIASMGVQRTLGRAEGLLTYLDMDVWDKVYVIQNGHLGLEDGKVVSLMNRGYDLGPAFELETIDQISLFPYNFIRISELKSIDRDSIFNPELREKNIEPFMGLESESYFPISQEADENWLNSFP